MTCKSTCAVPVRPTVEVFVDEQQFQALQAEWSELADRCPQTTIFQRYEWAHASWQALIQYQLLLVTLRTDGQLTAVAPLIAKSSRFLKAFPCRKLEVIASYESNHDNILFAGCPAAGTEALLSHLAQRQDWDLLILNTQQEPREPGASLPGICEKLGLGLVDWRTSASPHLPLAPTVDEFRRGLHGPFRRLLRRRERMLMAMGPVSHEIHSGSTQDLDSVLERLFALSRKGWAHAKGTAIGSTDALRACYGALARAAQKNGWLMLHILRVGDRDAAFEFNLVEKSIMFCLKSGYDPEFSAGSPGQVLRLYVIEDAIRRGLREYDMMGISEPYKMEWTDSTRPRYKWLIFHHHLYGRFLHMLQTHFWKPLRPDGPSPSVSP